MEKIIAPLKFKVHLREPMSGLISFLSAGLAIAGLVLMVIAATRNGNVWHVVSLSIFGASLILCYSASCLYHLLALDENGVRILRKLDHMMIFVLIAGTYTPFCLIPIRGPWGWSAFGVIWGLAIVGMFLKVYWLHAPRWVSVSVYLGMSWMGLFIAKPLIQTVPLGGLVWLAAGGLLYTIGAIFYGLKWPNPYPKVFGFHEIWHIVLMFASFCHFWAAFRYLSYL